MSAEEFVAACDALTERAEKPTVPEVLPLVSDYYAMPGCGGGGCVHVITEDTNIDQGSIDWIVEHYSTPESQHWWGAGLHHMAIARLLQRCSRTQRGRLAAMSHYPVTAASFPTPEEPRP